MSKIETVCRSATTAVGYKVAVLISLALFALTGMSDQAQSQADDKSSPNGRKSTIVDLLKDNREELAIKLPAGRYSVEGFVVPQGRELADGASPQNPERRIQLPQGREQFVETIDPTEWKINNCCGDSAGELQITYRDLNPFEPPKLGVSVSYEATPTDGAEVSRLVATAGDVQTHLTPGVVLLDTGELPWRSRNFIYPIKRLLGRTDRDEVFVTSVPGGTTVQSLAALDLGKASHLEFVVARCGALTGLNLRWRSSRGSMLVERVLSRTTSEFRDNDTLVSLPLDQVRRDLGLGYADKSLQLYEVIATFQQSADSAIQCRPLRQILTQARPSMRRGPIIIEERGGIKIARIPQTFPSEWSDQNRKMTGMELSLTKFSGAETPGGIIIESISFADTKNQSTATSASDCTRERRDIAGRAAPTLEGLCPVQIQATRFSAMDPVPATSPRTVNGLKLVPKGNAAVIPYQSPRGVIARLRLLHDQDSLDVTLDAFGTSPNWRTIDVRLTPDFEDDIVAETLSGSSARTPFLVEPGQVPRIVFRRIPTGNMRPTTHDIIFASARDTIVARPTPSDTSGQLANGIVEQSIDWTIPAPALVKRTKSDGRLIPHLAADDGDNCIDLQGGKICSRQRLADISVSIDGMRVRGAEMSLQLPTPVSIRGHSVFRLDASQPMESAQVHYTLAVETEKGQRQQVRLKPGQIIPLFSGEDTITRAELTITSPESAIDVILKAAIFASFVPDDASYETWLNVEDVSGRTVSMVSKGLEGFPGVTDLGAGSGLTYNRLLDSKSPTTLIEIKLLAGMTRGELLRFSIVSNWTVPFCGIGQIELELRRKIDSHVSYWPICRDSRISPADAMPPHWSLDSAIEEITVRIIRHPHLPILQRVYGAMNITADLELVMSRRDALFDSPVASINGDARFISRSEISGHALPTAGTWVNLGDVMANPTQDIDFKELAHRTVSIRSLRFTPLAQ